MSVTSEGVKTVSPPESRPAESVAAPRLGSVLHPRYFAGILSVAGGLLLWELISRFLVDNALFLAAPSQIAVAIYNLAVTGELWHHIGVSAAEFALGYVIASVLGIALGLAMASSATDETGAAAVGVGPLCHADHRAGAAVHSLVRHRHLVESDRGDHRWCCFRWRSIPRPDCAPPASG